MPSKTKKFSNTMRIDLIPDVPSDSTGRRHEPIVMSRSAASSSAPASLSEGASPAPSPYQDLLESIYDAVVITDLAGRIVEVNARATEFFLCPLDVLCGMFVGDIVSGATVDLMDTLMENLNEQRFTLIQAYCVRRDGSFFPSEIAVSRLRFGEGQLCFFVRDITVRRQAEEMLRTEHNALQNAGTGIVIANLGMEIEYVNPAFARLAGFARARDLQATDVRELVQDDEYGQALMQAIAARQSDWVGEVTVLRADGVSLAVQVATACNRNSDGDVVGFVFSFVDLSDRHRAEDAMRDAERHRVMLESLGAACHHLGQPATVLTANLGLIRARLDSTDPLVSGLVDSSLGACERLGEILHKMNAVGEYRTMEYLTGGEGAAPADRILQF